MDRGSFADGLLEITAATATRCRSSNRIGDDRRTVGAARRPEAACVAAVGPVVLPVGSARHVGVSARIGSERCPVIDVRIARVIDEVADGLRPTPAARRPTAPAAGFGGGWGSEANRGGNADNSE